MKIVFLSYTYWPPSFGGELRITIDRLESLTQRGHEIVVLTSGVPGYTRQETQDGITVLRSPVVGTSRLLRLVWRVVFWLWSLLMLLRLRYDVLHWLSLPGTNVMTNAFIAYSVGLVGHLRGARVVTVHSLADNESTALDMAGTAGLWMRLRLRQTDVIVGVSPALAGPLQHAFPDKAVLVTNAIRDDVFLPVDPDERRALRAEHKVVDDTVVFSFLGSIGRRKGFDLIAAAFATLAPDHPAWRLWVIGPHTRTENQNLDIDEVTAVCNPLEPYLAQVHFWGRIDDREALATVLGASDVFVFPTRREGMPLSPMEAMAACVPLIISRLPGVTDLANVEGETGLYIPPDDVEALKGAMLRLGDDAALRARMGTAARKRIIDHFSWRQHIDRWEHLYAHGTLRDENS